MQALWRRTHSVRRHLACRRRGRADALERQSLRCTCPHVTETEWYLYASTEDLYLANASKQEGSLTLLPNLLPAMVLFS